MTDFGAEESFVKAAKRMKDHHGIEVNPGIIAKVTLKHARRAEELMENQAVAKAFGNKTSPLVVEMDGGMVPLVSTNGPGDRRKKRELFWSELRVGVVQRLGETNWRYTCSFGTANDLGNRMLTLLERQFGWSGDSRLHGVGDGATWITEQMERIAGTRGNYLVDLYHLSEYLAGAVTAWTFDVKKETHRLKERLKKGQLGKVNQKLRKYAKQHPEHEGLHKCIQYIANRPGQFCYDQAIERGLPIGSGKVESTHRFLIQARLKKPGAWWKRENASSIANLRVLRANNEWDRLWQSQIKCEGVSVAA